MPRSPLAAAMLATLLASAALAAPPSLPQDRPATPGEKAPPASMSALRVAVSIPPLLGLVKPLLPNGSTIESILPPGVSEHGFELSPGAVDLLSRADLVVLVGLGLEPQIEKVLANQPREGRFVLRFAESVNLEPPGDHGHDHEHDHADDHDHGSIDPHLWLDPMLAGKFIADLSTSLMEILKQRGGLRFDDLAPLKYATAETKMRINDLDLRYRERLEPFKGRAIVTDHNAFSRLASRYGIEIPAVIRAAHGEPTPAALARIAALMREKRVNAVFSEPQTSPAIAKRLGELAGVPVLTLDPLGDGDWFAMMNKNLDALEQGLKGK